jgi:hypothetical protein
MSRNFRTMAACAALALVALALSTGLSGCGSGSAPASSSTTPELTTAQSTTPSTTSTVPTAPSTAPAPVSTSPVQALQTLFGAIQSGDYNTVTTLTGGSGALGSGIISWGSTDLNSFVGHTVFSALAYTVLADDGNTATVQVTGSMVLHDPGGAAVTTYDINGQATLHAKSGSWQAMTLPNYGARCCR